MGRKRRVINRVNAPIYPQLTLGSTLRRKQVGNQFPIRSLHKLPLVIDTSTVILTPVSIITSILIILWLNMERKTVKFVGNS